MGRRQGLLGLGAAMVLAGTVQGGCLTVEGDSGSAMVGGPAGGLPGVGGTGGRLGASGGAGAAFAGESGGTSLECAGCEVNADRWSWLDALADAPLFTAAQVEAVLGEPARFVSFGDAGFPAILAETTATGESLIVTEYPTQDLTAGVPVKVYRLGVGAVGGRFVAVAEGSYFLVCSDTGCAVHEIDEPALGTVAPLPGGTVPEGFIGAALQMRDFELCVLNGGATAWCFDREAWTEVAYDPNTFEGVPFPGPPRGGPTTCAAPDGGLVPLTKIAVSGAISSSPAAPLFGVTSDGSVVTGQWPNAPDCCCVRTAPVGEPVDLLVYDCGLAANPWVLTADNLYGTTSCPMD